MDGTPAPAGFDVVACMSGNPPATALAAAAPGRCRGMNLIEVMIAMAVAAVLLMVGLPSMSQFMSNSAVRAAASVVQDGVQLARSEAIRRNTPVEFVLVSDAPIVDNVGAAGNTAGPHWIVRVFQTAGAYTAADFIQGGDTFSTPNAAINAAVANFTFGGLGRTNLAGNNIIRITNPLGGGCFDGGGPVRCLNVVVQIGGQVRMCDPAITIAGDTRAC